MTITILVLSTLSILTINKVEGGNRATFYVGGTGAGNYSSIQAAINDANNGDTVLVFNGTYNENVVVNKEINLRGEDKETTIINFPGGDASILISGGTDNVTISGFTVDGPNNQDNVGIYGNPDCSNILIEDCIVHSFGEGISIRWGYSNLTIKNCTLYNNKRRGGITFLEDYYDNIKIVGCICYSNRVGMLVHQGKNFQIYHNYLYSNNVNAFDFDIFNITWNNNYPSGGNYYDDYTGMDNCHGINQNIPGSDGIGDTPYLISGGNSQDRYPLMNPIPPPPVFVWVDNDFNNSTPGWNITHFNKIQDGIDAANENETVYVYNGTYLENVVLNKNRIKLLGENKHSTIIDANGAGDAVYIGNHDYNTVSGFTIKNANGNGVTIFGYANVPYFYLVTTHNTISDCIIKNNTGNGVYIHATGQHCHMKSNVILDCTISNNGGKGIYIHSDGNHCAIGRNPIVGTFVDNNSGDGIHLRAEYHHGGIGDAKISGCTITNHNGYAIRLSLGGDSNNYNHIIYHNNFINNSQNVYDPYSNTWYKIEVGEGNYYSDYDEPIEGAWDNNSDGIVDTPYDIPGGSNQDLYPLMHPWSDNNPPIQLNPFPPNGSINIPVAGTPINLEIYDIENDTLWSEIWSNYTGSWIQYAGWNLGNESWRSTYFMPDYDDDKLWDIFDIANYYMGAGWVKGGHLFGFFDNDTVTDEWGMTNCNTLYYWSVNVTDNTTWTNVTYHFATELSNIYVDDDYNTSTSGWGFDHFDSIQDGIDAVAENGTVYVFNGTYNESFLMPQCSYIYIDKSMNLVGEHRDTVIINCPDAGISGGQFGIRIGFSGSVNVSNALVSGFTINGGEDSGSIGIYLQMNSDNITIENCSVHSFADGLSCRYFCNNITVRNFISYNNNRDGGIVLKESGSRNIEIYGCDLFDNSYGIYINDAVNCTISDSVIYSNNLTGVYLENSRDSIINNNNMSNNSYGIHLVHSHHINISNCSFSHNGDGIVLSSSDNNTISHCDSYSNINRGANLYFASNNSFEHCNSYINGQHGIRLHTSHENSFSNCSIYNNNVRGFQIGGSNNNIISNCSISNNTQFGILLGDANHTIITNNRITYNKIYGLWISGSHYNTISENIILNNNRGIRLTFASGGNSSYNIIVDNLITSKVNVGTELHGIYLEMAHNNTIIRNNIISNDDDGILLYFSDSNNIVYNLISSNKRYGLHLHYSRNNNIINNKIYQNYYEGLYLQSDSENNSIYHNNILDNIQNNASDWGENFWDNGYPSGGNYWGDYLGIDTNGDGIGEVPYNISGGDNQDRYPFVDPLIFFGLSQGWNLITVPFNNAWTAETLGQNISDCTVVIMYNSSSQTFLTHVVGTPHDDFPILDGVGYFIYVSMDSVFAIRDVPIASINVAIEEDWNLIGWCHETTTTAESLGQEINGTTVVIMFNSSTQTFLTHVVGVPHDNFTIKRGMGLFIYTTEGSVWHGEG